MNARMRILRAVAAIAGWATSLGCQCLAADAAADGKLDEVIVTATLRSARVADVPASVSVLTAATLKDAGQQSIEDVVGLIPNLNWAGDTSRPRYFQLRGIGELEQYQGAPNPSVGFLIDDMDFSGLGTAGTLFDLDRVEVLRGPQATRYGANALAGLIYLRSAAPDPTFGGRVEAEAGDYNTRSIGAVLTGPVQSLDSGFRLAAQRYYSDGFYHNAYLNRHDTDRRDELTLRGRWTYAPSEHLRAELTALHIQIDNGYDAFAIDNSRTTQSDNPGIDAQHSSGAAVRVSYAPASGPGLTFVSSYARTLVKYSYDGDWGNPQFWAPVTDLYNYTEAQNRKRTTRTVELRLGTEAPQGFLWLLGLYGNQLDEGLIDTSLGAYDDVAYGSGITRSDVVVDSGYRARNGAIFGELDGDIGRHLRWSVGLRAERWTARYLGTTTDFIAGSVAAADVRPANDMWGGHGTLTYRVDDSQSAYLQVARGYKAGGFNLSQGLRADQLLFGPEWDVNLETGYKAELFGRRLTFNTDIFYLYRHDAQIKTSFQSDPTNPNTFVYYTGNAARGNNYGLESEIAWRATTALTWGASFGLLRTHFQDFTQQGTALTLVSRELANAPHWQAAVNVAYRGARGEFMRVDLTGMGGYYFDLPPNETRSSPYAILNAKLGWESPRWSAYLYGRNLTNKSYPVRGFFFGDEPPDFPNKLYIQLGDPLTFGVHVEYRFGGEQT